MSFKPGDRVILNEDGRRTYPIVSVKRPGRLGTIKPSPGAWADQSWQQGLVMVLWDGLKNPEPTQARYLEVTDEAIE